MKWKTKSSSQYRSRFAFLPTRMTHGQNDHDKLVWLETYWTKTESYHGLTTWVTISDDDYRKARIRQWEREFHQNQAD